MLLAAIMGGGFAIVWFAGAPGLERNKRVGVDIKGSVRVQPAECWIMMAAGYGHGGPEVDQPIRSFEYTVSWHTRVLDESMNPIAAEVVAWFDFEEAEVAMVQVNTGGGSANGAPGSAPLSGHGDVRWYYERERGQYTEHDGVVYVKCRRLDGTSSAMARAAKAVRVLGL